MHCDNTQNIILVLTQALELALFSLFHSQIVINSRIASNQDKYFHMSGVEITEYNSGLKCREATRV